MRIATIIMAHKNPEQLEKLIRTMYHPNFDIYVHIDKKVEIAPFEYLNDIEQVYFIKDRVPCNWGGFSLVEAMLNSIYQIQASAVTYEFVSLLSAQDFPVKPMSEIYDFLYNKKGFSFLSFDDDNETAWWKSAEERYKKYHFTDFNLKGKYVLQKIANIINTGRTFPVPLKLYGGNKSTWWTISYDASLYLTAYFKDNRKLIRFLKLTWGSDEFIITSILMNSPFQDKIINDNYRYINWSLGTANPEILLVSDYSKLIESKMLFARKFDANIDAEVIDKLYTYVTNKDVNS